MYLVGQTIGVCVCQPDSPRQTTQNDRLPHRL
jgi:hypothetical protein